MVTSQNRVSSQEQELFNVEDLSEVFFVDDQNSQQDFVLQFDDVDDQGDMLNSVEFESEATANFESSSIQNKESKEEMDLLFSIQNLMKQKREMQDKINNLQADLDTFLVAAEGSVQKSIPFTGYQERITEVEEENESICTSVDNRRFKNLYLEPSPKTEAESTMSNFDRYANPEANEESKDDQ